MKTEGMREIPAHKSWGWVTWTCDLCGADLNDQKNHRERNSVCDVEIVKRVHDGEDYSHYSEFDCCPPCWDSKVRPALEALIGRKIKPRLT